MHMTWKMRLLAVLTMGVLLAAVSVPAFADVWNPVPPIDITTQVNPQSNVSVNTIDNPQVGVALGFKGDASVSNQSQNLIQQNQANQSCQTDDSPFSLCAPELNQVNAADLEQEQLSTACKFIDSAVNAPNCGRIQTH